MIYAVALSLALALVFANVASGRREVVRAGNLFLADNGGIFPSKLPRHEDAPIKARLIGEIGTADGSHPPALRTVDIDIDRTIEFDARGLPTCRASQVESRSSAAAKAACGRAIIGSGRAEVEVEFPEQAPFSASGPVLLFNGGVHGRATRVLLHAYVSVPAPTAIVTKVAVDRIHEGRFGMAIEAQVPRIAGGAGSVTKFDLAVGRSFAYEHARKSLLTARCPTGEWATKGQVRFDDGTKLGVLHIFPCTPTA